MNDLEKMKYPVGKFNPLKAFNNDVQEDCIQAIENFPKKLRAAVDKLSETDLNTPYRPEGWTIHQLIHHCADSHMNAYMRFKLSLTEDTPTIKTYDQGAWAETEDVHKIDALVSLSLLDALHTRWTELLRSMTPQDFEKPLYHPELGKTLKLDHMLQMYGWHSNHHLAHVTKYMERNNID